MATIITSQVGNNYCPQLRLDATVYNTNDTTATVSWSLVYVAHGYALNASPRTFQATINGTVVASRIDAVAGVTANKQLQSGNITVAKGHGAIQIPTSITAYFSGCTWNGASMGIRSATGALDIPSKTSYAVKYNANGGSGAPGQQTKWYGETLTLSSTKPTRTGYKFAGWATSASGSVAYQPGGNYTANAAVTLYAKWTANTYTVTYNANGGSGAPGNQTKTYGVTLKLSSTKPTRTNYNFKGWGTSASSTTASYQPGGSFTGNYSTTLYAVWQLAYTKPRITNLDCMRCTSAGVNDDEGKYAKVTFKWATDKTVSFVTIVCNGVTTRLAPGGTSGSISQVVGAGALSTENSYNITVGVSDASGSSSDVTTLPPTKYIIDVASGGNGIAFGRVAYNSGWADFGFPTNFYEEVTFSNSIRGLGSQAKQGSTTQYLEIARSNYTTSDLGGSGHIRIHGSIGGYDTASRGPFDVMFTIRDFNDAADVQVVTRSNRIVYSRCNLLVTKDSSGYLHVYIQRPSGQYYAYHVILEGVDFTVPNTLTNAVSGTVIWRLSTAAISEYPVGTVMIRYDHTSPASLYGGTWTRISSRFLYATSASGTIGSTGGSNTHTLTVSQIPSHTHGMRAANSTGSTLGAAVAASGNGTYYGGYIQDIGGGGSHNNAPAFINVSIWRRTA